LTLLLVAGSARSALLGIPAQAGMPLLLMLVIPAKAGIQFLLWLFSISF